MFQKRLIQCQQDSCVIQLCPIGGMWWDEMYRFGEYSSSKTISKKLNREYDGEIVPDHHDRIILLSKGQIIYEEDISRRSTPAFWFFNSRDKTGQMLHYEYPSESLWLMYKVIDTKGGTIHNIKPIKENG